MSVTSTTVSAATTMQPSSEMRTPEQLIRLYWDEVWNNGNVELIREICADPIIRHDPSSTTALSHDEQVARVRQQIVGRRPLFTHEILVADDEHVTSVWNVTAREGPPLALCGIEVFRAEQGRLSHAWNSGYAKGLWGRIGDPSVPVDLPPPGSLASPDKIDPDWVQRVFAASGTTVPRVSLIAGIIPIGHGTMSDTVRVELTYNADAASAPPSLVCKFPPTAAASRQLEARFGLFAREVAAYRFLGATPPCRLPRCHAAFDDAGGNLLVLEDLRTARPGDQLGGCTPREAGAVIDELAKLHAAYWQSPALDDAAWLMRQKTSAELLETTYKAGAEVLLNRLGARLEAGDRDVISGFIPLVGRWLRRPVVHPTFLHGDPRVDNVLFEQGADGTPLACLIDWQIASCGDAASDIAYFLTGSLEPDDRRACERELIASHARTVSSTAPDYIGKHAEQLYRTNIFSGLLATVNAASAVSADPHNDRLLEVLARRNCAAVRDWDGFAALVNGE